MDTQTDPTFGAPPSGLPPLAWMSGLNLGQVGMSGAQDQSLSGSGGTRGMTPGQAPGLGLDELSQLLAAQADAGTAGVTSGGSAPFSTQAIGQQATLPGGYGVAGQTGQQGGAGGSQQSAQGAAAGSADPLAILQKLLGLVTKGGGLLGQGGGGATGGGTTGGTGAPGAGGAPGGYGTAGQTSPSGGPQGGGFGTPGVASPINLALGGVNPLDVTRGSFGPTGTTAFDLPGGGIGATLGLGGSLSDVLRSAEGGAGAGGGQQFVQAALQAGLTPDQIQQMLQTGIPLDQLQQVVGIGETGAGYATPGQLGAIAGQNTTPGATSSLSGTLGGGAQAGLGLLNLIQGAQGGNAGGAVGGGLQGIGGLAQILQSNPQLASALGITPQMLGTLGPLLGGAGGLLGIASGAQGLASGNPGQIGAALPQLAGGGLAAYQALQGLLGQGGGALTGGLGGLGTAGLGAIYGLMGSGDPTGGGNAGGSLSGLATTLAAASQGTSSLAPLAGAVSGPLAAVAPVVAALIAYFGSQEEKAAREAGWANNPIAGGLNSAATQGVGTSLGLLDRLQQGGGYGQVPTQQLLADLPTLVNNLGPYFSTAQGPKGPITASDALTGLFGRPGLGGTDQYTANEQRAQQGVTDIVQELLGRGVSYEDLGKIPVSNAFTNQTMDMYNPLRDLYAGRAGEYNAAAAPLLQNIAGANRQMLDPQEAMRMAAAGQDPRTFGYTQDASGNWYTTHIPTGNPNGDFVPIQGGQLTPDLLFQAAQGAGAFGAPDSATNVGGLVSSMYGGPLWAALARMGGQASPFWGQIQQHFNPWATVGGFSPQQLTASLQPLLAQLALGGGGIGGGLPGNSEGSSSSPTGDGVSSGVW